MRNNWHAISLEKVFVETGSKKDGLNSQSVTERLKKFGRNALPQERPYSKIRLFLIQFNSSLMYILLATQHVGGHEEHGDAGHH